LSPARANGSCDKFIGVWLDFCVLSDHLGHDPPGEVVAGGCSSPIVAGQSIRQLSVKEISLYR
jgi:hypothetical protein